MASYTKLKSGEWGIRSSGTLFPGALVAVTTKAGKVKMEIVQRVVWTGKDRDGSQVTLASIEPTDRPSSGSSRGNNAPGGRTCSYCGSRECSRAWNPRDLCDED